MINTDKFFQLVERTFDVDEITPQKIMDKFYSGTFRKVRFGTDKAGKQRYGESKATISGQSIFMGLAERLSEGKEIVEELKAVTEYNEMKKLKNRAGLLDIHSKEVTKRIESKMTELSKELIKLSKERTEQRLLEERQEKQSKKLEGRIERVSTLGEVNKVQNRIIELEETGADAGSLMASLNEKIDEIEFKKEQKKEETLRRQEEARIRKEKLREEGIEPEF